MPICLTLIVLRQVVVAAPSNTGWTVHYHNYFQTVYSSKYSKKVAILLLL